MTEEHRKKLSLSKLGDKNPMKRKDVRIKNSLSHLGKKQSRETIEKHKKQIGWNKGIVGKLSHSYKDGSTRLLELIRGTYQYRQWRSDVFTRDNFTCQKCGRTGIFLNAHHIEELFKIVRRFNITTIEQAIQCSELWNINNGLTLCQNPCHRDKHKKNV
jgi:hypothetical protein